MNREKIFQYAGEYFGTEPEYLWSKYPDYAVLRRKDNSKWYAVVMNISKSKLGLPEIDVVDVINVKCDPLMMDLYFQQYGFFPAYHMNKSHWISIILDGSVSDEDIFNLLNVSYEMTGRKK